MHVALAAFQLDNEKTTTAATSVHIINMMGGGETSKNDGFGNAVDFLLLFSIIPAIRHSHTRTSD